jgi:hypothetical protein
MVPNQFIVYRRDSRLVLIYCEASHESRTLTRQNPVVGKAFLMIEFQATIISELSANLKVCGTGSLTFELSVTRPEYANNVLSNLICGQFDINAIMDSRPSAFPPPRSLFEIHPLPTA